MGCLEGILAIANWLFTPNRRQKQVSAAKRIQNALEAEVLVDNGTEDVNDCLEEIPSAMAVRHAGVVPAGAYAPVVIRRNRRLRAGHRGRFMNHLITSAKCKFGACKPLEANRIMVTQYMHKLCEEWGLVTGHSAKLVPLVVSLFFVPTEEDVEAVAILNTRLTCQRVRAMSHRQGEGWFNNPFGIGSRQGIRFINK